MIARGEKIIEVRTRRTNYRGPLLICASKVPHALGPAGVALAIVDLLDCRTFLPADATTAGGSATDWATEDESWPTLWAWVLGSPRIIVPVPVRGMLGIFTVDVPIIFAPISESVAPIDAVSAAV